MKDKYSSVLQFKHYIVKHVEFDYNLDWESDEEGINIDFDIDVDYEVGKDNTKLAVILKMVIFENPEENNYPFTMNLEMIGMFTIKSFGEEVNIDSLKPNALAILYPYVRSLVSSYTANANVEPLILPTMNINSYLKDCQRKKRKL